MKCGTADVPPASKNTAECSQFRKYYEIFPVKVKGGGLKQKRPDVKRPVSTSGFPEIPPFYSVRVSIPKEAGLQTG